LPRYPQHQIALAGLGGAQHLEFIVRYVLLNGGTDQLPQNVRRESVELDSIA
jgi:hypothetical protein